MADVKQKPTGTSDAAEKVDARADPASPQAPARPITEPRRTSWMAWAAVISVLAVSAMLIVLFVASDSVAPTAGSDGYVLFDPATISARVPDGYAPSGWEPVLLEGFAMFDPATIEPRVPIGFFPVQMRMNEGYVMFEPGAFEPLVPEWISSRVGGGYSVSA